MPYVTAQAHASGVADVTVQGADQAEYNVRANITVLDDFTFTYAVAGAPASRREIWAATQVFVSPSLSAPPLAMLAEAMVNGAPPVVSDRAGAPDLLGGGTRRIIACYAPDFVVAATMAQIRNQANIAITDAPIIDESNQANTRIRIDTAKIYAIREISVQGQVKSPQRVVLPAESTMSVLEAVTKCGGFTDTAKGTEVRVTRIGPDGKVKVFVVDVDSLIKGKNKAKSEDDSLLLLPGDIIYVPERFVWF